MPLDPSAASILLETRRRPRGGPIFLAGLLLFMVPAGVLVWCTSLEAAELFLSLAPFILIVAVPAYFASGAVSRVLALSRGGALEEIVQSGFAPSEVAEALAWSSARRSVAAGWPALLGVVVAALLLQPRNLAWVLAAALLWPVVAFAGVAVTTCLVGVLGPVLQRPAPQSGAKRTHPLRRALLRSPLAANPFLYREGVRWFSRASRGRRFPLVTVLLVAGGFLMAIGGWDEEWWLVTGCAALWVVAAYRALALQITARETGVDDLLATTCLTASEATLGRVLAVSLTGWMELLLIAAAPALLQGWSPWYAVPLLFAPVAGGLVGLGASQGKDRRAASLALLRALLGLAVLALVGALAQVWLRQVRWLSSYDISGSEDSVIAAVTAVLAASLLLRMRLRLSVLTVGALAVTPLCAGMARMEDVNLYVSAAGRWCAVLATLSAWAGVLNLGFAPLVDRLWRSPWRLGVAFAAAALAGASGVAVWIALFVTLTLGVGLEDPDYVARGAVWGGVAGLILLVALGRRMDVPEPRPWMARALAVPALVGLGLWLLAAPARETAEVASLRAEAEALARNSLRLALPEAPEVGLVEEAARSGPYGPPPPSEAERFERLRGSLLQQAAVAGHRGDERSLVALARLEARMPIAFGSTAIREMARDEVLAGRLGPSGMEALAALPDPEAPEDSLRRELLLELGYPALVDGPRRGDPWAHFVAEILAHRMRARDFAALPRLLPAARSLAAGDGSAMGQLVGEEDDVFRQVDSGLVGLAEEHRQHWSRTRLLRAAAAVQVFRSRRGYYPATFEGMAYSTDGSTRFELEGFEGRAQAPGSRPASPTSATGPPAGSTGP